jgi:amino acid permease
MGAAVVRHKEFAIAAVNAIFELYMVVVIIPVKCKIKLVEEEAIPLLSIPFCFFSFSYHSVVHVWVSFQDGGIKRARE